MNSDYILLRLLSFFSKPFLGYSSIPRVIHTIYTDITVVWHFN